MTTTLPATTTRSLLGCAVVAGPLWAVVSLAQVATRDGFDLTRHPLSMLSTGGLGWLQIANFVVAGLLLVAGSVGLARALHGTPGGRWAPRLIGVGGLGMVAAGVLVVDPGDGFPAGTPAGPPASMTWHGLAHLGAGSISFLALIVACFVLGRHFARGGDTGSATVSRVAGAALLLGNAWAISGGRAGSLTLAVGFNAVLLWISAVAARHRAA